MDRNRSVMTKKILDLTMEIIYLLTGEKYAAVKMTFIEGLLQGMYPPVLEGRSPILEHAPYSLESERNNDEKIIEVAQNIIDLLTGEVPIRCQDVTVYFSMEEWEYIEGHKDLYKDVMMEKRPPLTSPDGSSNRNPHSPYYRDSFQEDHTIPHHQQGEDLNDGTVPYVEETSSMADDRCLQDIPPEISRDAHHTRRSSEERSACSMIKDDVEDSQGENRVTPNIHPGPYSADTSTDSSNSKNSFTEEAHSVMPSIHFGLQNVDRSLNPSISEEPSPMELDTISPNIPSALSRSPDLSFPIEPPDKLHTAPNIKIELHGSPHPINPQESSLDVSCTLSPNIHLRLQNTDESLDLTNPEESTQDKPNDVSSNINLGLHNTDRPPESKESSPVKSHTINSNIHLELNRSPDYSHPERSSAQSQTDVNMNSGVDSSDRSVDASKPKQSFPINAYILTPKIHSAHESSLDGSGSSAFSLSTPPGVPSVDRSADPSNPRESFATKSHSVTLDMYPEPSNVHRSPVPLNPEACHPMQSQTASADMHSECHRSPDPCCVGESSTTSNTIHDVYSGPHNVDRSLDPDKSSATSHTIPNGNSEPHSAERIPNPCYLNKSFATSLTFSNGNSGPHNTHRSLDPDESSATSPTIPHVNSVTHSVGRSQDHCYPQESSATSHTIPNVNSGPHSEERLQDPSYPHKPSDTSPTIPNVNSEVHNADNPPDPVKSWVSFLMKLHTSGSNMHSSLTTSLNPSDPDDSCDKQLPVPNMNSGFRTSSRSPLFTNLGESYPDKSNSVTPNLQSDHYNVDRIPDLTHPGKPQAVTQDVHLELPSVDRTPSSPESSLTKSHVLIQSILNKSLDPSYSVESSTSSQTPANLHSSFDKADRSTDYLDLGASSLLKSHTVSSNTQAVISRSLDPSYPVEPSEISHTALNINAGLSSTSRSLHSSNPKESSLDISHTVTPNIHPVHHCADRALDHTNPEESSAEIPDTPDIHHSVNRTPDPEVSCPMRSHNITSNTYSEFNSPDPSDKSSLESHTAPHIHSGLQTTDSSQDPPIDYLLSNKLLITLNVHPELYLMDKSSIPSYPEEYSSIKSLIISPNIRSLRGRSPDPSSDEPSDKLHTAPNISLGFQSADRSLHSSYSELCSVDITHAVTPNINLEIHSVDTTLDREVSDHMKSHTVTTNLHSLNRSPDSCYPDESTAKSHSSPNNYAGDHIQSKSLESNIDELSPPNVSLNVDSNVLPEHDIANRSPNSSCPMEFCPIKSSIVSPNICSFNRSPDSYYSDVSSAESHSSPNIHAGHHSENRSPDLSIAEQFSPNVSLNVDSNALPEHQSVDRSPSHSDPKDLIPMESHTLMPNVGSAFQSVDRSPGPSKLNEYSIDASNIHPKSSIRSLDPIYNPEEPSPTKMYTVCPITPPGLQIVDRSPDPEVSIHTMSQSVTQDAYLECHNVDSPPSPNPKEPGSMELPPITTNILQELCNAPPCLDSSGLHTMSQSVTQDAPLERHNVDSPPSPNPKEPGSMDLPPITTNILQELCNAPPCLDSSGLHTMSQSVTQDAPLGRHNGDSPPSPSNPKEPGYMELPPITTSILQELCNAPPCLDSSGLHTMSQSVTQDASLGRHNVDSPPSPSNPKEPGYMELPPITTSILQELCNAPPCLDSSGLHTMSQSVTQDAPLERHNGDSPPSPSNTKESRSSESPPITTDILQELCNAHRCLDSTGLHESFQALALNIYYENPSAHNLADPFGPEELAPNGSLAITPTNHPEICSLDKSPKSSEESSLEKSYYVLPNIQLEPRKADQSPDTSNLQETSFKQTFTVTPNNALALNQTLEASNSEEHSQDKSHALTINPSNPKQSLSDRSGCATGNADKNGLREFSCPVCGRCFRRQPIFMKHWGIYCGKIFKEKPSRKKKSDKKSSPPAKRGKLFKKKEVVLKEPNTQQSTGPYPCPECGKFYSQKSNLLQHRRIHTGLKPFSCLHCGKTFTKKISLVTHIRIHSGEKPFKCIQCGKCFGQQGHLDRHRKMHTGEKPHPCPECDKSFLQKCDLVKHQRIHTGQRPYLCPECGKSFTETSGLKRHRRLHR